MQLPVQITFRDVPASEPLADSIREHADRLDRLFERITRCDVTVGRPGWRGAGTTGYVVRIDMSVPGGDIIIGRGNGSTVHNDPYSAVHDAFDRARRRLEEYMRIRHERARAKPRVDS
jgi:ribosome-associated translation inhibitor RaiA